LSTWSRSESCEFRSPAIVDYQGNAACLAKDRLARQTGVAFFLVTFSWRARKRSFVKAEFLRAQKIPISEKLKSNQPPVCHRQ
jgi:hypothetical protein